MFADAELRTSPDEQILHGNATAVPLVCHQRQRRAVLVMLVIFILLPTVEYQVDIRLRAVPPRPAHGRNRIPVSYTHLTLPTKA